MPADSYFASRPRCLVVTDLDGSLLDHDSYDWSAARPALAALEAAAVPVVLASSKTRSEMLALRHELGNRDAFIVENGAAIVYPDDTGSLRSIVLGQPRRRILTVLAGLRGDGYRFACFADWSPEEIARETGLEIGAAGRAAARDWSEPLLWRDCAARLEPFRAALEDAGLVLQEGGRFFSVSAPASKADALRRLLDLYAEAGPRPQLIVLGDGPNDEAMLDCADVAVVVRGVKSARVQPSDAGRVIRTELPGPAGWNAAVLSLSELWRDPEGA